MNCQEITNKISSLIVSKKSIDLIEEKKELSSFLNIKQEINSTLLEVLPVIDKYEAQINFRKLVAEKHGFEFVSEYHEGLAWGKKEETKFLVNDHAEIVKTFGSEVRHAHRFVDGSAVIEEYFEDVAELGDDEIDDSGFAGLAAVESKFYLIDKNGEKIAGPFGDIDGSKDEKILCVYDSDAGIPEDAARSFIRRDGTKIENIIPRTPFSEGIAWVRSVDDSETIAQLVDETMNPIGERIPASQCFSFRDGISLTIRHDCRPQFFDREGRFVGDSSDQYTIQNAGAGRFWYQEGTKTSLVEPIHNKWLFQVDRLHAHSIFSEGLAVICEKPGDPYYFINEIGEKVLPKEGETYDSVQTFADGFAIICQKEKTFFIDHEGSKIFGPFEQANSFEHGVAWVMKDGKEFYIDHKGKKVFKK